MATYVLEEILKSIQDNGGPETVDLSGLDLSELDLGPKVLEAMVRKASPDNRPIWISASTGGLNLHGARLREINLQGANLEGADLWGANLQGATLIRTRFQRAVLRQANLQGARLTEAILQGAELGEANLQGCTMEGVRAHGVALNGSNLQGANLRVATLQGADLRSANLQESHLGGAKLQGADLEAANLQGVNLGEANIQGASLKKVNLTRAHLWWANLQGTDLTVANLQNADLRGANLQGSNLSGANLLGADLRSTNLQGANLQGTKLENADLRGSNLQGANLQGANLREANLSGCHLEGVDLSQVTTMEGVRLHGAFLERTEMRREKIGAKVGEEKKGEFYAAREVYRSLVDNFTEIGKMEEARWALYKEWQMLKESYRPPYAARYYDPEGIDTSTAFARLLFGLSYSLKWFTLALDELFTGYGQKPLRIAGAMALVLVLFPFLYLLLGGEIISVSSEPYLNYFLHSLLAFVLVGLPFLPFSSPQAQLLAVLEALLGVFLLFLFLNTPRKGNRKIEGR